jgi:transcriptional antiterminator
MYDYFKKCIEKVGRRYGVELSNTELSYITIHFCTYAERLDVDFVVTTVGIEETDKPVLRISPLLTDQDRLRDEDSRYYLSVKTLSY